MADGSIDDGDMDDNMSITSDLTASSMGSRKSRKPCLSGAKCWNADCQFVHPLGWAPCNDGENCATYECTGTHPYNRSRLCKKGGRCWVASCRFLHPARWSPCEEDVGCCDFGCAKIHPPGRLPICVQGARCLNIDCDYLHPDGWDPSEKKVAMGKAVVRPGESATKSQAQRAIDRSAAALPIYVEREQICNRLRREKVLVVTAATGSGKTTQIPQYCAEAFGGIVVCTQPRVMAAISIAKRIAVEYDGGAAGNSVGYQVGGKGNRVQGRDIMMLTDAALVRMSQDDRLLSTVKVLHVSPVGAFIYVYLYLFIGERKRNSLCL
jgi:hypothetical protein